MPRIDNRPADGLRPVKITPGYLDFPAGSVLVEWGRNRILCAVSVCEGVPPFMLDRAATQGWLSTEYALMPCSTPTRTQRESTKGAKSGRTQEIQRLIGRSLRAVMDFSRIPNKTVWVDCDVIQADGGTRTASVTGAFVALVLAMRRLLAEGKIPAMPVTDHLAAVSVGAVGGELLLDLCYAEDSRAEVDMNIVQTGAGRFVEVQGTAEHRTFDRVQLDSMLDLASSGIRRLIEIQKSVLGPAL